MDQKTNLGFLMSICHDKVIHIAQYLHVDQSLVGKWKNGVRTIDQQSPHLDALATYMLLHHEETLDHVFQYDDRYMQDKHAYLKSYLCGPYHVPISKSLSNVEHHANYETSYFIYEEESGRKKALDYFFNCASILTPGKIHFYDGGCLNWLDTSFCEKFSRQIKHLLQHGWKIQFYIDVLQCDEAHSHFDLLLEWLSYENFILHYIDHPMRFTSKFPIYFIEDALLLHMYTSHERSCYVEVYYDHQRLSYYQYYFAELERWTKGSLSQLIDFEDDISFCQEMKRLDGEEYFLSELPSLYGMSASLIEKVLNYNPMLSEKQKVSMKLIQKEMYHHFFHGEHEIRMMFSLTAVQAQSQKDGFYYDDILNRGHHVYIQQEDFKNYLRELTTHLSAHVPLRVGLLRQQKVKGNYHVKEHGDFMYMQDHQPVQVFKDRQISHLFYRSLQHQWYQLENKDKVIDLLKDSLES